MNDATQEHSVPERPEAPTSVAATGVAMNNLLRLMLKAMFVRGLDIASDLGDELCLPTSITNELLEEARLRKLVEVLGAAGLKLHSEMRYALTGEGRAWATEALEQCQYIGPAPVTLDDFKRQIAKQRMIGERVAREALVEGLGNLVVPDTLVGRLGPAINSGRSMLLYGAPGNGKTTVAEVIGSVFQDAIFIPYCIDVDGQIIKVFDPTVHKEVEDTGGKESAYLTLRADASDRRWALCRRPVVIVGGELTLSMLDLSFNQISKFYEAPLHLKAIGGTFIIDDLGRQLVQPEHLLNRWITPMEKNIDYLTLDTGRTFTIPFDELLIFSTNLTPDDLMDPAFLRRIPYKIEIKLPTETDFKEAFRRLCELHGLASDDGIFDYAIDELQNKYDQPLSFYQPKFIVDQIIATCRYDGGELELTREHVAEALANISAKSEGPMSPTKSMGVGNGQNVADMAAGRPHAGA